MTKEEACKKARKLNRENHDCKFFVIRKHKTYVVAREKKMAIEEPTPTCFQNEKREIIARRKKYYKKVCSAWHEEGKTTTEISMIFDLSKSTIENWIRRFKRYHYTIDEGFFLDEDEKAFLRHKERIAHILKSTKKNLSNREAAAAGGMTLKKYEYVRSRILVGAFDNVKAYRDLYAKCMA